MPCQLQGPLRQNYIHNGDYVSKLNREEGMRHMQAYLFVYSFILKLELISFYFFNDFIFK